MNLSRYALPLVFVCCSASVCRADSPLDLSNPAAPQAASVTTDGSDPSSAPPSPWTPDNSSSSSSLATPESFASAGWQDPVVKRRISDKPFSSYAATAKIGVGGYGLDLATTLGPRMNLRVGGSYFEYNLNILADKIVYNGDAQLRRASMSVDYFPFSGRLREGFRVSPGVTLYNGNKANAVATVAPGQTFFLANVPYVSSTSDPVHGNGSISFGNQVAPSITVGFGNMIPRNGAHWSVPFEIGFEYVGQISVGLNLNGTACQNNVCQQIATNPSAQANLVKERQQLSDDLNRFRFYPIASIGVSYRFGKK